MLIPEIILYRSLTDIVKMVAEDYNTATDKTDTIIYRLFNTDDNGDQILFGEKDNWLDRAKTIFTRDVKQQRKLEFFIGYNLERVAVPTVHILLPNESKGKFDSIGYNDQVEVIEDVTHGKILIDRSRTKSSTYHLMITSDNSTEVLITYYYLQALLLMFYEHFELKGFVNMSVSGADVIINQDMTPPHIFHRNLAISFDYEYHVKTTIPKKIIEGFKVGVCVDLKADVEKWYAQNQQGY